MLKIKDNVDLKELFDEISIGTGLTYSGDRTISRSEAQSILDYITNLQQENLSLAKENEQEKQFIKDCGFENVQQLALNYIGIRQEKEYYKSRCEQVREIIKTEKKLMGYAIYDSCLLLIEEALNGEE